MTNTFHVMCGEFIERYVSSHISTNAQKTVPRSTIYLHPFLTHCVLYPQLALPDHVQDIEDPNHPSLEEERGRAAGERRAAAVESKKLHIQRNLASMKALFRTLQQR